MTMYGATGEQCQCGADDWIITATLIGCACCPRVWGRVNGQWRIDQDTVPPLAQDTREQRCLVANEFIRVIARHGRQFFRHPVIRNPQTVDDYRVAWFQLDGRGRLWFHDAFSEKRIYTHREGRWRGFTNGGTLLGLVKLLRDYILGRHELPMGALGPWPKDVCGGDLWGYGDSMNDVRRECAALVERSE